VKYELKAFEEVESRVSRLEDELHSLQEDLSEIRFHREETGMEHLAPDPSTACELVSSAADTLVEAIAGWIPSLVPAPRGLHEVLDTLARWQPHEQSLRAAQSAQKLLQQVQATSYGQSLVDPSEVPNLDEFIEDLRATLHAANEALSASPSP